jgi:hypothetical protein
VLSVALALAAVSATSDFRELNCTGVPEFPAGKHVLLRAGQVQHSAYAEDFLAFVEFEGTVALVYYDMRRVAPTTLKGTATRISTFDWEHQSLPVECRVVK